MQQSEFLQVALKAAEKAEEVILHYYSSEIRNGLKPDQSPVTIADIKAEEAIKDIIKNNFPDHGILGEESGENPSMGDYTWIVDPIDGTKNYLRGIPLFATEIALLYKGELILGVSNAPVLNELLYAERGKGAFLNDQKITVSKINNLNKAYLSFGGLKYFEKIGSIDNLLSLTRSTGGGGRSFGDFWAYHLLAQGKIDIVIEAQTKIWDIAALKVIVEEAGGKMTDIKGEPVDIHSTSTIASNRLLHNKGISFFS